MESDMNIERMRISRDTVEDKSKMDAKGRYSECSMCKTREWSRWRLWWRWYSSRLKIKDRENISMIKRSKEYMRYNHMEY